MNILKKIWKWILVTVFGLGIAVAAPVVPVELQWLSSYETLEFDTPSGDLESGYYAENDDGDGYYIRDVSEKESNFIEVDLDYDVSELQITKITGKAYYDEFLLPSGEKLRRQSTADDYWDLSRIPKHPDKRTSV